MNDSNEWPRQLAKDAEQLGQDAADKAKEMVSGLKELANQATDTGRTYAEDAINATGIATAKTKIDLIADYLTLSINADPIKTVLVTAALSALVTSVLISAIGSRKD